eukprot:TRINITY_DN770_c0_g1_i4.p1 TRINITY_DN770_c0_g1~~TRINITY_DN770_c0_g1_i4.p1  ORF type:complete len:1021 (-),score=156.04 TRINITY_DN770_c0_g1_i4:413-3475(-)
MDDTETGNSSAVSKKAILNVELVVEQLSKRITCLCPWKNSLIAGLYDGVILIFAPPQEGEGAGSGGWSFKKPMDVSDEITLNSWQVTKTFKNFSKKPIVQLEVTDDDYLIGIPDDGVSFYSLPLMDAKTSASRTRGATCFAWNQDKQLLAVGVRRKIYVLHLVEGELMDLQDISVTDISICLHWMGEDIIQGNKKQYAIVNHNNNQLQEIIQTGTSGLVQISRVSRSNVLIVKNSMSLMIGSAGRLVSHGRISWSEALTGIVVTGAFAVGVMHNFMEVRPVRKGNHNPVVKTIPLNNTAVLSAHPAPDGSIFVSSGDQEGVYRIYPGTIKEQVGALSLQGEYEEALELTDQLPYRERRTMEDELRVRYGHQLFAAGEYDLGLAQFDMCSRPDPVALLKLFPSLVQSQALKGFPSPMSEVDDSGIKEPKGDQYTMAVTVLLNHLLKYHNKLVEDYSHSPSGHHLLSISDTNQEDSNDLSQFFGEYSAEQRARLATVIDTTILRAKLKFPDDGSLLGFVSRRNYVDPDEGETQLRKAGLYAELVELYRHQNRHQEALDLLKRLTENQESFEIKPKGFSADLKGQTGIYQGVRYLREMPADRLTTVQAGWVVQGDPQRAIEAILSHEEPPPHQQVLDMLRSHAPQFCALYLEEAIAQGKADPEKWHMELAMIYLLMAIEEEKGSRKANGKAHRKRLVSRLSQRLIVVSQSLDVQDSAAFKELAKAQEEADQTDTEDDATENSDTEINKQDFKTNGKLQFNEHAQLKELILTSPYIDHRRLMQHMPAGSYLLEIRALLMEKLGQHKEALRVYVHELKAPQLAEAYCDRLYNAMEKGKLSEEDKVLLARNLYGEGSQLEDYGDIYIALLVAYIQGPDEGGKPPLIQSEEVITASYTSLPEETWQSLCELIGRKSSRINLLRVIDLLPADLPMQIVLPILKGAIAVTQEKRRGVAVVANLRKCEEVQVWEQLVREEQRYLVLTSDRVCAICHKRIGSAAFVVYPDNQLVHYNCYKRVAQSHGVDSL